MPQVDLPTGVSLYYETQGQGEPVVLIPSTGFSAEAWKPSQMPLAKSAQLIIHDPRGCGRSIATQQVYTINQMANDVVALLDHLGIKTAHFVGHSMGGRIALELALNFPGKVKSLIMAASGSGQAVRPGPDCIPDAIPDELVPARDREQVGLRPDYELQDHEGDTTEAQGDRQGTVPARLGPTGQPGPEATQELHRARP